jgi:hypothetical protein
MLSISGGLFSKVLEAVDIKQIKGLFEVPASSYWDDHFVFGKISRSFAKHTGSLAADIFLINSIIPLIFVYGQCRDNEEMSERALSFLEEISPEVNVITSEWKTSGVFAESAFYSQALIQLRNEYCKKRKCLDCRVGSKIISQGKSLRNEEELILEP